MLAQRPRAGEVGDVPEVLPALGRIRAHGVGTVGDERRINVGAHDELAAQGLRHFAQMLAGPLRGDRLQIADIDQRLVRCLRQQRPVPGVVAGLDHRLDHAGRLVLALDADHLDAGFLPEGLVERGAETGRERAARVAQGDLAFVCPGRLYERRGEHRRTDGAGAQEVAAAEAPAVLPGRV